MGQSKREASFEKNKRSTFKVDSEKELAMFPLLEAELYKWVVDNRKNGCVISGTLMGIYIIKVHHYGLFHWICPPDK